MLLSRNLFKVPLKGFGVIVGRFRVVVMTI